MDIYYKFLKILEERSLKLLKYEAIKEQYDGIMEFAKDFPEDSAIELENLAITIEEYLREILIGNTSPFLMEIKCGTGGLDAQEWTEMLFSMYTKYFYKNAIKFSILSIQEEESGIRGCLIKVNDIMENYLCEQGVHRLVRISPFNAQKKRQTSFASVHLIPFQPEKYNITVDKKDLKIDTYRASGAGGQHVNKTESAVRITHLPTNIVVQCQTEKSQLQNRETAMEVLLSKLQEFTKKENTPERKIFENSWSGHFRSYVFDPYKLIKDNRLNIEINNNITMQDMLNGQVNPFMEFYRKNQLELLLNE